MSRQLLYATLVWLATLPVVAAVFCYALMWGTHRWNSPAWLIVCSVMAALSLVIAWRAARRWMASHFRFSLRGMLIAMAVVAVLLSTIGQWWLDFFGRGHAIHTAVSSGASVEDGRAFEGRPKNALYSWIGFDPFDKAGMLEIGSDQALLKVLDRPRQFRDFTHFSFDSGTTSAGFEHAEKLNQFPNLRGGQFMGSVIDDRGLSYLRKWDRVPDLFFNGCSKITNAGLVNLTEMSQLTRLSFVGETPGMSISDAGLAHVGKIKNLKYLMLLQLPQVTDAGLDHLHGLANLEYALIRNTGATEAGFRRLMTALPDCRIVTDVKIDYPGSVQRIVTRTVVNSQGKDEMLSETADPGRIAEIVAATESFTSEDTWIGRADNPLPGSHVLQFYGATRVLYEVRIGEGKLQKHFHPWTNWVSWRITADQQQQLLDLVLPRDEVIPNNENAR